MVNVEAARGGLLVVWWIVGVRSDLVGHGQRVAEVVEQVESARVHIELAVQGIAMPLEFGGSGVAILHVHASGKEGPQPAIDS
jgi:hypothetical protein